ncbi:hypothetical protein PC112_g17046 [Phytophthora cactorum]|nr:hypothetical protein PC112_g17046 [Phytophthora cactorum]
MLNPIEGCFSVFKAKELKEYNALLSDDLKLQEDELEARFYKFGGIAKTIFAKNQQAKGIDFKSAIEFYDALTVVNYVQTHRVVREEDEIHQLLQMVPSKDSFRESSYLTLVSDYVLNDLVLLNKDNSSLLHLGAALSASPNPLIKGAAGNTIHGPGSVEKLAERITVCQLLLSAGNDPVFVREGGSVEKILKATKDIGSHCEVVDSLTGFMDG